MKQAKDIMKQAITLDPAATLADARELMLKYNISRIVVAKNKKPMGIVTEKSIGKFLYRDGRPLDQLRLVQVMRKDLITVNEDATIKECAKLMLEHNISSLLVNDTCNIFTKTDLVKVYAEYYKGKNKVIKYMVDNVYTITPTHSLHSVLSILIKKKVSRVIVIKDNKPVGIITTKDLLPTSMLIESEENEVIGLSSQFTHVLLARDVMKKPLTIDVYEDLAKTSSIMIDNKISGLPVVDSQNNLKGIITKTDIIKALSES